MKSIKTKTMGNPAGVTREAKCYGFGIKAYYDVEIAFSLEKIFHDVRRDKNLDFIV